MNGAARKEAKLMQGKDGHKIKKRSSAVGYVTLLIVRVDLKPRDQLNDATFSQRHMQWWLEVHFAVDCCLLMTPALNRLTIGK